MTATITVARDEVMAQFAAAWAADAVSQRIPVAYPDVPSADFPPLLPVPWARISMVHSPFAGGASTLAGETGTKRFTRVGIITVEIYTPAGDGFKLRDQLVRIAEKAFDTATPSGVWFRGQRSTEVGSDGPWFHSNTIVEFEYDEIR